LHPNKDYYLLDPKVVPKVCGIVTTFIAIAIFFFVISCRALKRRCIVLPKLAYYINEIAQENGISSLSLGTLHDRNGNENQSFEEEQEPAFTLRALVTNATSNLFYY
jgi:hypothetical protein